MGMSTRDYYPVFINLKGRPCLVVGGGEVVSRKVQTLLECGARVKLVAPKIRAEVKDLAAEFKELAWEERPYQEADMAGVFLVIAGTDDSAVNARVAKDAAKNKALCNVVDDPAQCSFIVPATVRQGHLTIAISTDGISPALARDIRRELEGRYGPEYKAFLDLLEDFRPAIKKLPAGKKKKAWEKIVNPRTIQLVKAGKISGVNDMIKDLIHE
jgi:precorrin-2 dehydrogenase/sirohydrochlorin ferrochelatase